MAACAALRAVPRRTARISRLSFVPVRFWYPKLVAMNAFTEKPQGDGYPDLLVRISTDEGVEGLGTLIPSRLNEDFL